MNYRWFRIARGFFGQAEPVLNPTGFVDSVKSLSRGIKDDNMKAMMNVDGSNPPIPQGYPLHSTIRHFINYRAKPGDDPSYKDKQTG